MTEAVQRFVHAGRELPSWIAGFLEYTENIQSPEAFRLWAAISAVAGAMERKVWIRSQNADLYPNLYVFLVGPPGAGKTRALNTCERIWRGLGTHHVAETSLTKAALIDRLAEANRIIHYPVELDFNSLLVASGELGALIPGYDPDFLNALTYLYDCIEYTEKRRAQKDGPLLIPRPQVNLVACTTPSFLINTLPIGAWDQGFLARVIICYSDITDIAPLNLLGGNERRDEALERALATDMKAIGERVGPMKFTEPAARLVEQWHMSGGLPKPEHPRLLHYSTRRTVHLLKLCMVACVDRGADNIDVPDFQTALNWLTQVEGKMPDVFLAMTSGGDAHVINECWHYVMTATAKTGEGIAPHLIYQFVSARVPSTSVDRIIEVMYKSKLLVAHNSIAGPIVTAKPR